MLIRTSWRKKVSPIEGGVRRVAIKGDVRRVTGLSLLGYDEHAWHREDRDSGKPATQSLPTSLKESEGRG